MTSTEDRIAALLDRWLESLDLHRTYVQLDDGAYWQAREWVPHERPTAWVIELAREKTLELKRLYEARGSLDGEQVAAAIELSVLLANLVGSQNLERFVPLIAPEPADTDPAGARQQADPGAAGDESSEAPSDTRRMRIAVVPAPHAKAEASDAAERGPATRAPEDAEPGSADDNGDRAGSTGDAARRAATPRSGTAHHAHARTAGRVVSRKNASGGSTPAATARPSAGRASSRSENMVIADAVRLLKWGRAWHELAEAIARMSGRPALPEVRAILRDRRTEIETQADSAEPD
jgi:hypothetical protein